MISGVFCTGCTYDLRGLPAGACPECGRGFDPADESTFDQVPGVRRGRVIWLERAHLAVSALPLLTVVTMHAMLVAARVSLGRWPHRLGMDDPKGITGVSWSVGPIVVMMTVSVLAGPIVVVVGLGAAMVGKQWRSLWRMALATAVLWGVAYWFVCWDPAGALVWFMD